MSTSESVTNRMPHRKAGERAAAQRPPEGSFAPLVGLARGKD
jgi:hypothetical protein